MTIKHSGITCLLLFLVIFISFFGNIQAQPRGCGSVEYDQFLLSQDSSLYAGKLIFESQIRDYIQSNLSAQPLSGGDIIKIPIIIHKIGNNAIAAVTTAAINDQINILNQDYRKIVGTNGDGSGVDTKIEFCLAQVDPDGLPTSGVNSISGYYAPWNRRAPSTDANSDLSLKSLIHWPPGKYLNMYLVDLCCNKLGYSSFPENFVALPKLDGIAIDYHYFGNTNDAHYNKGRTATHEIGHWLGLRHIWGDEVDCSGDDLVGDTPLCSGENYADYNMGCSPHPNQCLPGNAALGLTDLRQIENYMDYSDDQCMNKFTKDQATRMLATLKGTRSYLNFASCTAAHCDNGVKDADETGIDCGGANCKPCTSCLNGIKDIGETGIDCGGYCPPCSIDPGLPNVNPCELLRLFSMKINGVTTGVPCVNYNDDITLSPIQYSGPACVSTNIRWLWYYTSSEQRCNSAPNSSLCKSHTIDYWNCNCAYLEYFIEIAEVDEYNNQIGVAHSKWFKIQKNEKWFSEKIYNITVTQSDLNALGVTLQPSKIYRIKLARTSFGWEQAVRFFRVRLQDIYLNSVGLTSNQFGINVTLQNMYPSITNVTVAATNSIHILPKTSMGLNSIAVIQNTPSCSVLKTIDSGDDNAPSRNTTPLAHVRNETNKFKEESVLNVSILPNPNNGIFTLQFKESNTGEISIYNNLGQVVYQTKILSNQTSIDLSSRPKGIYFVKVQTTTKLYTQKVVVQ